MVALLQAPGAYASLRRILAVFSLYIIQCITSVSVKRGCCVRAGGVHTVYTVTAGGFVLLLDHSTESRYRTIAASTGERKPLGKRRRLLFCFDWSIVLCFVRKAVKVEWSGYRGE